MAISNRDELSIGYDAVSALLEITEIEPFPFRLGIMRESDWERVLLGDCDVLSEAERGVNAHEVIRCSASGFAGVSRRVREIAAAPMFQDRFQGWNERRPGDGGPEQRQVIYLVELPATMSSADAHEGTHEEPLCSASGLRRGQRVSLVER